MSESECFDEFDVVEIIGSIMSDSDETSYEFTDFFHNPTSTRSSGSGSGYVNHGYSYNQVSSADSDNDSRDLPYKLSIDSASALIEFESREKSHIVTMTTATGPDPDPNPPSDDHEYSKIDIGPVFSLPVPTNRDRAPPQTFTSMVNLVTCNYCGRRFVDQAFLTKHLKDYHHVDADLGSHCQYANYVQLPCQSDGGVRNTDKKNIAAVQNGFEKKICPSKSVWIPSVDLLEKAKPTISTTTLTTVYPSVPAIQPAFASALRGQDDSTIAINFLSSKNVDTSSTRKRKLSMPNATDEWLTLMKKEAAAGTNPVPEPEPEPRKPKQSRKDNGSFFSCPSKRPKKFQCDNCTLTLSSQSSLDRHKFRCDFMLVNSKPAELDKVSSAY